MAYRAQGPSMRDHRNDFRRHRKRYQNVIAEYQAAMAAGDEAKAYEIMWNASMEKARRLGDVEMIDELEAAAPPPRFQNVEQMGGCIEGREFGPFVARTPEERRTLTDLANAIAAGDTARARQIASTLQGE
jgi:hypothetical protein